MASKCVVVPFYNNRDTVCGVITSLYNEGYNVIAVADGPTDGSLELVEELEAVLTYKEDFTLVALNGNKGKGRAIVEGMRKATEFGYRSALTFDADGQHTLQGAKAIFSAAENYNVENVLLVGSRACRGADKGGRFANNFSNFWLKVQTGRSLPDTQSGCRLYPVLEIADSKWIGSRYEFETEALVRLIWRGIEPVVVPIDVLYTEERITHFRPLKDFFRISLMNTLLTFGAIFYGYPAMLIRRLAKGKRSIKR